MNALCWRLTKIQMQNLLALKFTSFFPPLSISIFQGQLLQGTIWENIKKELGKIILQLFAPEIHLSIFYHLFATSSILHFRNQSFPSSPLFVLLTAFLWSPGSGASFTSSVVLVFKYIPCLGEKQHIKATRPKLEHLRVWLFLLFELFFFFFCTVYVCVSDILSVQF